MGRVNVPRCDNCGAPVEFASGVLEARCEYCNEVLIRDPPAPAPVPPPVAPQWQPPPRTAPRAATATKIWPYVITGGAMLTMAGASGLANFAAQMKPLPAPAPESKVTLATVPEVRVSQDSSSVERTEARGKSTARSADAGTTRGKRLARPTASAPPTPTAAAEPPKAPPFDTQAAIAGLDAAKVKAESSCKSEAGARLFVNMGFDPDGVNRGASVSDSKLRGTPEAKCVLRIFRSVRIPAFDLATRPSGLGRPVRL
jgi:hypothetical protein